MIPRLAVAALLGLLSTLGALANASPPDPGWIGGFYDAADDDDVILAVTGMDQASGLEPPLDVEPHNALPLGTVVLRTRQPECAFALAAPAVRAPPPA